MDLFSARLVTELLMQEDWPRHRQFQCKEPKCKFRRQLFRGAATTNALALNMQRDNSEQFALYLHDKFPTARELQSSGLGAKLRAQVCNILGRMTLGDCPVFAKSQASSTHDGLLNLIVGPAILRTG